MLGTAQYHPARAKTSKAIRFRQSIETDCEDVFAQGGNGNKLCIVINNFAVDLIGKNYQLVAARKID